MTVEWTMTFVASFEADTAADAEVVSQRLLERVLKDPATIEAEAWTERTAVVASGECAE